MTVDKVTHAARKVAATRCSCCNRTLTTGEGTEVPFIGALGPECVQKFTRLLALLEQVQAVLSPTTSELVDPEADFPVWAKHHLYALGFEAQIVIEGKSRRVKVQALRPASKQVKNRAAAALAAFEDVRAEFEQRLMLAAADAQAAAEEALAEDLLFELEERAALQAEGLPGALPLALTEWLQQRGVQVDAGGEAHMPLPLRPADESLVHQLWQLGLDLGVAVRGRLDLRRAEYVLRVAGTVAA